MRHMLRLFGWMLAVALVQAAVARVPETPQFRRIGVEQGLPSSRINALAQDRAGYLWIATDDGVARFDGLSMRVWRHNPGIVGGMPDNLVNAMHIDREDRVWLSFGKNGVGVIDALRREVRPLLSDDVPGFATADVWAIAETPDGSLWFGSFGDGLFQRDPVGRVRSHGPVRAGAGTEPDALVVSLATTTDGRLFIGTATGLAQWVDGRAEPVSVPGLDGDAVTSLQAEADGSLWIGARSRLWRRDPDGRIAPSPWDAELAGTRVHGVQRDGRGGRWLYTVRGLYYDDGEGLRRFLAPEAAEGDYQQMLVDRQGGLWFGDAEFGLVWLSGYWRSFATLTRQSDPSLRLSMRQAGAIAEDRDGSVLIGGEDGRLDRLDASRLRVEPNVIAPEALGKVRLYSLARTADGALWVGAASGRLSRRDASGAWRRWVPGDADAPPRGAIDFLVPLPDGGLWVAGYGGGLQRRDAEGRVTLTVAPESGHGLDTFDMEAVTLGPDGALWVANAQGLLRWDGTRFERQLDAEGGPVQGVAFGAADDVWVYRPGLLQRWRREAGAWTKTDQVDSGNDGLPSAEAGGLVRDAAGRLWLFTVRGLLRFDPATRAIRRFGPGDGLGESEFGLRPPQVLADGVIVAGTVGGAVVFDPMQVEPDTRVAPMVLESISVRRAEDVVDLDAVAAVQPGAVVTLQPEDRDLRVVARLMSFADPAAHRYRFRLNGYDPDWVDVGPSGERLLPRQSPGRYTLDLVAAGADGRWSAPVTLTLEVLPPWWRTWWAWALYALTGLALGAVAAALYRRRVQAQAAARGLQDARRVEQQASEAKTAFLADLGHELRTPLTGVLGMTELMLKDPLPEPQRQRAETVMRAGQHLLRLVNDTLDLARIEAGRLRLEDETFELAALATDVGQLLRPNAEAKGLEFTVQLAPGLPPRVRGDEARLRQILLNLGGNAIKFTERGRVTLALHPRPEGGVQFDVEDTGIGLDDGQQRRLFQRFEQAEGEHTQRRFGGTGLGLAISRELARAMGGELTLRSAKGEGSCFSVRLPLPADRAIGPAADTAALRPTGEARGAARRPLALLLVEDDPVVAEVMLGLLGAQGHRVHHAPQALTALTLLKTERIDVGLLDLDLPAVDGFELATLIRQNGWTLPLIAVTARADAVSERRARAAGMDGYLRKPVTGAMLAEALDGIGRATRRGGAPIEGDRRARPRSEGRPDEAG
jgi:signal transduction histidine kinase/ligand-binding sensor domain-containing protein/CheY-like chemotaxis protein